MNSYSGNKTRYQPTLIARLLDDAPGRPSESEPLRRWSVEELKASVAQDLEALLNSRAGATADALHAYPNVADSLVSYGLSDFVGRSLASPVDRAHICRTIEHTIAHHEPRLKGVRVGLVSDTATIGRLHFSISAMMVVRPTREPVSFDALLQPTTQQYSIAPGRAGAQAATGI